VLEVKENRGRFLGQRAKTAWTWGERSITKWRWVRMHGLEARARMAVPRNCGQGAKTGWGGWAWYEHRLEARGTVQTPRTGGGANRGQAFRRPLNGAVLKGEFRVM